MHTNLAYFFDNASRLTFNQREQNEFNHSTRQFFRSIVGIRFLLQSWFYSLVAAKPSIRSGYERASREQKT